MKHGRGKRRGHFHFRRIGKGDLPWYDSSAMWLAVSGASGAAAVLLGAFGAHALKARLGAASLASWNTAVLYHLVHSVVLLALALYASSSGRGITLPAALFAGGILMFSGSIYLLVLMKWTWLGPVTPLGGLLLVAGWLSLWTLR